MSKHFISALLDLKEHFPDMAWFIGTSGRLHIEATLTPDQQDFMRQAQQMFEPAE